MGLSGLAAVAACGDDRDVLPIATASVLDNGIAVQGYCHDGYRLDAEELGDVVELTLSVERTNRGNCFSCVTTYLESVVGDRQLVDAASGEPIPLDGDPALADCLDEPL